MSLGESEDPSAKRGRLLDSLSLPHDVRTLNEDQLARLAAEVRERIVLATARTGGHLASPLGATDIAVALLHVFDAERDPIIWDVGHQAHAWKILTDRRDRFDTIRRQGGICGYPARSESTYDAFGTGHSSTSISAALGMAVARDRKGGDNHVVAVIGDGALTGGMAFEALSHLGELRTNVIIVLNDNEMSISKNVGGLSTSLSRLRSGGQYNRARGDLKGFMERLGPGVARAAHRVEHSMKGLLVPGVLFEELGIRYFGPIEGNDLSTLTHCLENLKQLDGPVVLHCATQKGKGYVPAESDPLKWHGVTPFSVDTGEPAKRSNGAARPKAPSFTNVFTDSLIDAAETDRRVVAITAGMPTGTGLATFEERFPDRFFDVGICEQHAVTFAAGLATQGMHPVCAIYSTFLQRGYDQYIHDVCLQNLPVVFAIDRAGLVGEDSPTQQGAGSPDRARSEVRPGGRR